MSLIPPDKVGKLQAALHDKAKRSPSYRFYLLYDKVHRMDVLTFAYECCRRNAGAPGVDGQDFNDIEKYGRNRWLGELAEDLRKKTYQPQAVRRVWIPKPEQYAYRKQRSALEAVTAVNEWLHRGYTEVVDADLSGYFDQSC